ncbi:NAD(P)H-hydrate dehydratase [Williamsia sterculiae]|nr:NAD(P)H-hydrate dehydratase [Williamsia sterculiae]
MRRAASGLAGAVAAELRSRHGAVYGRAVTLVIGSGDNGGDALFAGAVLRRRGVAVSAVLTAPDRAHAAGLAAFRSAGGRVVDGVPDTAELVVDGVVGLRGTGPLREAAAAVFAQVRVPVVAVDVPSGVDADTGVVHDPSVRAEITVTFGARRIAHALAPAACGRVEVVDIGIDADGARVEMLSDRDVAEGWPLPGPASTKYTQGVVGVIAGSDRYPGAGILCSAGAVAATSGMVRYVGSAAATVVDHFPEVVVAPDLDGAGRVQAWVVGPGAGTDDAALELLRRVLATDVPVLVDADGLTVLAHHPELVVERHHPTLLTPHDGEFERLAGRSPGHDRLSAVRGLASALGATVLLKGKVTLVADPGGEVLVNDAGNSWAATAGAGDVLSGIAGALLAAGLSPRVAGAAAARVHALAADLAADGAPIGASELARAVRPAVRSLRAVR